MTPIKGVVEYPGDGFSVTKYSKNKKDAFKFLDFLTTTQAGNIINAAGLIPDISGLKTTNPVNQEMLNFVTVDHMTPYPMMDNYVQVNVGNAADSELPSVLANQTAPLKALAEHGAGVADSFPPRSEAPRTSRVKQDQVASPSTPWRSGRGRALI